MERKNDKNWIELKCSMQESGYRNSCR